MQYFAQLAADGVTVQCVFEWDVPNVDPVYHPSVPQPINVTQLDPLPAAGWTYDAETAEFTPPA